MEVASLGHSSFRIKSKGVALVTDPYGDIGLKFPRVEANIVTISHDHSDHNAADLVKGDFKVVNGPGEYEIQGISIIGLPTYHDDKKGQLRGKNTIYIIEAEKLRVAHLGDLGHKLDEKQVEAMGEIDILLIPVGAVYTIDSTQAVETVQSIEPRICIPMHFNTPGLNQSTFSKLETVDKFLKKITLPVEKLDKLSIKKELIETEQKVVVLK